MFLVCYLFFVVLLPDKPFFSLLCVQNLNYITLLKFNSPHTLGVVSKNGVGLVSYKYKFSEMINVIFLITKQYVYMCKCREMQLNFMALTRKIHNVYEDEKYIAYNNNKVFAFEKVWYPYSKYVLNNF